MARHPALVLGVCFSLALLTACGNDDAAVDSPETPSTTQATRTIAPHDADAAPQLEEPSARYTILHDDLSGSFITDIEATRRYTAESYSLAATFSDSDEGYDLLVDWGYVSGYESSYIPEGQQEAVLNGAYYFVVESHLFESEEGASEAYDYISNRLAESRSEKVEDVQPVGNESSFWEAPGIRSSVDSVHHRVVFRRGNLVAMVATWGADALMSVNPVYELARIVDEKALGERDAPEPTPTSNGSQGEDEEEEEDATAVVEG